MADKKITQLDAVTSAANTDLLLIVRDPSTTPVNKKLEVGDLFGETAQTVFTRIDVSSSANTQLRGNYVRLTSNTTLDFNGSPVFNTDKLRLTNSVAAPANSNNSFYAWPVGSFAWNTNYLYIAVSPTLIARFAANTSW